MSLAPARPAPSDVDLAHLEAPDRVSVKPHASPALHAINFLLGRLDESYLPRLREFGGLQSYPSRSKARIRSTSPRAPWASERRR